MKHAPLGRSAISQFDRSNMLQDVLDQPRHLVDAWSLAAQAVDMVEHAPGGLLVCGVGGSGVAGDLCAAIVGDRARRPIITYRGYDPRLFLTQGALAFCPSYSGNTDITISCFEMAGEVSSRRVALSSGGRLAELATTRGVPRVIVPSGLQPRAATAYSVVAALALASACGAAPDLQKEVVGSAELLTELAAEWGPDGPADGLAKRLALELRERVPIIHGTGPTLSTAHRWKTQLNETGKHAAFASEVLEAGHHELCIWSMADPLPPLAAIFLDDPSHQHPNAVFRIEQTAGLIASTGAPVHRVLAMGESRADTVLSMMLLADLVAVYLAVLKQKDPSDIPPIDLLNQAVSKRWRQEHLDPLPDTSRG